MIIQIILIIFLKKIIKASTSHFSDNHAFNEYAKFLNIDLDSSILSENSLIKNSEGKIQRKVVCKINKNVIYKDDFGDFYDSGYLSCDWEIDQVEIECHNDYIEKMVFRMRNFKNSQKKYLNGRRTDSIDELIRVPKDTWIKGINKEFYTDGNKKKYLIGIKFIYANGKNKFLTCVEDYVRYKYVKVVEKVVLEKFSRFSGYVALQNPNSISNLSFYQSTLKGINSKLPKEFTYKEVITKCQVQYPSAKEKSLKIGQYGLKSLYKFEDKTINSSWKLSKLEYCLKNGSIKSIKTNFQHNYFKVPFENKIHSVPGFVEKSCEKIEIDFNVRNKIRKIKIKQNYKGDICGIIFQFKNGRKTRDTCEKSHKEKVYEISRHVHFIGFHGSFSGYALKSLGLLIREKRGVFID